MSFVSPLAPPSFPDRPGTVAPDTRPARGDRGAGPVRGPAVGTPVDPTLGPDGPDGGPDDPHGLHGLDLPVAGAVLRLLAQRALWWPAARTVFVADVHLGKAETFRSLGVPVPVGPTGATLARLAALVDACRAERLVVLGDLLHARQAREPATLEPLRAWRRERPALRCMLVRGNHDDRAGDPPPDLAFDVVEAPAPLGPFALCHEPTRTDAPADGGGYRLAGHLHPAVRLTGRADGSVRLRCFVIGAREAVLPAFGEFTGAATVVHGAGERLFAIAGDRVLEIPATGAARRRAARGAAGAQ
jgi:DNA ligase-associated metallophosphoesterase